MRLVWSPWKEDLFQLVSGATASVDLAVAYISTAVVRQLLHEMPDGVQLRVLARCHGRDFRSGIADLDTFRFLADHPRAQLRAMQNLHAKLYVVDSREAFVGSGNLTRAGLGGDGDHNEEAGLFLDNPLLVRQIQSRFDEWWQQAARVDHQFVDKLSRLVGEIPKRLVVDSSVEDRISGLARMRSDVGVLFEFSFKVNKSFRNCNYVHVMHVPDAYFGHVQAQRLAELGDIDILCPDRRPRRGYIRSSASRGHPYYRIRVRCDHSCTIRDLRIGQWLHVEVSRRNGTVRIGLRPEEPG